MREISVGVNNFLNKIIEDEGKVKGVLGSVTLENIINFIGQVVLFDKKRRIIANILF